MDDLDQHRKKRLALLIAAPPYNGDRSAFIKKSGLSKGRISQLLDPQESFGERAGMRLAESLGLADPRWFDKGAMGEVNAWPFLELKADDLLTLDPDDLAIVEKVALSLVRKRTNPTFGNDNPPAQGRFASKTPTPERFNNHGRDSQVPGRKGRARK